MSELMDRYEKEKIEKAEQNSKNEKKIAIVGSILVSPFSDIVKLTLFYLSILITIFYSFFFNDAVLLNYYLILLKINLVISFGNSLYIHGEFYDNYVGGGILALLSAYFLLPIIIVA